MQKAFGLVKLKSVFSSPKPTGLASQVPRHLVHTPPTHTHPRYRTMSNLHFTQTRIVETLIVGASGEAQSDTDLHTYWRTDTFGFLPFYMCTQSGVLRHE